MRSHFEEKKACTNVRTVCGDTKPESLGFTHCHEHLFVFRIDGVTLPERLIIDSYENTKAEVVRFAEKGGGGLVDVQPFGAGRHPELLQRLCEETGVGIIASTGFHKEYFYPSRFWAFEASVDDITDLFVSEIEEGMYLYDRFDPFRERGKTRAGIIKIATGEQGLTPYYRKVFDAAAEAHRKTAAPIITHTELSSFGRQQAEYLIERGVDPACIIISHMDRKIDIEKNRECAELGVFLEYDTIARAKYHSDAQEAELIRQMILSGFCRQILLGMDVPRDRYVSYGGGPGLDYIMSGFVPLLEERGISPDDIAQMTVKNPAKALCFAKR
jgi:predicted metal-dependent phosphotriesterase family hydrolase